VAGFRADLADSFLQRSCWQPDQSMTVRQAILEAEAILPGRAAPEGESDPRWQAIIAVSEFCSVTWFVSD
jgi:hypothetical protein